MRDYFHENSPTRFVFPIDGDHVNENDGRASETGVTFTALVHATPHCTVTINGTPAEELDGVYRAEITVTEGETRLTARNECDKTEDTVAVFYLPRAMRAYRISSDDNILFLYDITKNKDTYTSIFDNPYLAVYKKAHDLYDAKVHLNLFYAFDDASAQRFSKARPAFDLSMMTDKFKAEWKANAHWLTLSFHARTEMPNKPYQFTAPETVIEDFRAVRREIIRFAGEETFSGDVTTVHWGEITYESTLALRDLGHKAFTGYFEVNKDGDTVVSYYLPAPLANHVSERDFWRDTEAGVTFGCIDRVINLGSYESALRAVCKAAEHPHRGGFVSVMIHEQYFYADYVRYLPDFEARVLDSAKLLFERGYRGSFVKEVLQTS